MWAHQYDAFDGFDLYFVNVRGQGESPMKVGLPDLEGAIQDVDAILSYFQLDKVILVGHSWGGNPLQEYTYRHPERVLALVMVDSWGSIVTYQRKKEVESNIVLLCTKRFLGR